MLNKTMESTANSFFCEVQFQQDYLQRLKQQRQKIEQLSTKYDSLLSDLEQKDSDLQQRDSLIEDLNEQVCRISCLERQIEQLRTLLHSSSNQAAALKSALSKAEAQGNAAVQKHGSREKTLLRRCAQLEGQNAELSLLIGTLQNEVREGKRQQEALEARYVRGREDMVKAQKAQMQKMEESVGKMKEQLMREEEVCGVLAVENECLRQKLEQWQMRVEQGEQETTINDEEAREEMQRLKREMRVKVQEMQGQMQQIISDKESQERELRRSKEECVGVRKQMEEMSGQWKKRENKEKQIKNKIRENYMQERNQLIAQLGVRENAIERLEREVAEGVKRNQQNEILLIKYMECMEVKKGVRLMERVELQKINSLLKLH